MKTNKIELAYIAGFFDGEGCVRINKRLRERWNPEYSLFLSIGQKDGFTLDWIKSLFGGNVYQTKRDNSFTWTISNKKAYFFLKEIYPYSQYKKPQIELAIQFMEQQIMKAKRHKGEQSQATLLPKDIAERETMYLEMKNLKKVFINSKL